MSLKSLINPATRLPRQFRRIKKGSPGLSPQTGTLKSPAKRNKPDIDRIDRIHRHCQIKRPPEKQPAHAIPCNYYMQLHAITCSILKPS